ncbi:MAG: GrpB family protein [Pseudomonadota bacterium]|nr:GrpB family protein [Pseudomonadota bacterium]
MRQKNILGLARGTIRLVPHSPAWVEVFREEAAALGALLGSDFLAAEHIGSTAIPGIVAKPVLDMMVAVPSLVVIPRHEPALISSDWHNRGCPDPQGEHVLFAKGPEECRTVYLKLTTLDSAFWKECLLFRDYLRAHPQTAQDYEALKLKLAQELAPDDRKTYTARKASFIRDVIGRASFLPSPR